MTRPWEYIGPSMPMPLLWKVGLWLAQVAPRRSYKSGTRKRTINTEHTNCKPENGSNFEIIRTLCTTNCDLIPHNNIRGTEEVYCSSSRAEFIFAGCFQLDPTHCQLHHISRHFWHRTALPRCHCCPGALCKTHCASILLKHFVICGHYALKICSAEV